MVVPSNYHLDPSTRKYCAFISIGGETMINNLDYVATETMECEGFYPERAIIIEEKYQQSGRTNGLFTGLMTKDGEISNDNPQ
jgi:predicted secreted acid phosphatase